MEFFLSEEQRISQDTFRKFAEAEIAPLVEEAEETESFPLQLFPQMGKRGYLCPRYSEKYGGAGIDKVSEVLMREEISRVSQGIASSWLAHSHLGTFPL